MQKAENRTPEETEAIRQESSAKNEEANKKLERLAAIRQEFAEARKIGGEASKQAQKEYYQKINGEFGAEFAFDLGRPYGRLAWYIPDKPISLTLKVLLRKMKEEYHHKHPFTFEEAKDLAQNINDPAFFLPRDEATEGVRAFYETESGRIFCASVKPSGEINEIETLYPKDIDRFAGLIKSLKGHPEKVLDIDVTKAVGMLERQYDTAIIPELRDSLESAIAVIRQIAADKDAGNAQTAHNAAIISEQADNPADAQSISQQGGGAQGEIRPQIKKRRDEVYDDVLRAVRAGATRVAAGRSERTDAGWDAGANLYLEREGQAGPSQDGSMTLAYSEALRLYRALAANAHMPKILEKMPWLAGRGRDGRLRLNAAAFGIVDRSDMEAVKAGLKEDGMFLHEDPSWRLHNSHEEVRAMKEMSEQALAEEMEGLAEARIKGKMSGGGRTAVNILAKEIGRIACELPTTAGAPQDAPRWLMHDGSGWCVSWRLKSDCVNAVWTSMRKDHAGMFQRMDCGYKFGKSLDRQVELAESLSLEKGKVLPAGCVDGLGENMDMGVILVEGCAEGTNLVLECTSKLKGVKRRVAVARARLSVSKIEKMYRWLNLRNDVPGGAPLFHRGDENRLGDPTNWPDAECGTVGHIAFVHGFNVNTTEARSSAAETFKRLWQSGLKSAFTAVEWYGDIGQINTSVVLTGTISLDYYANALHAFETAQSLATNLNENVFKPRDHAVTNVVIAHSLGNILVSSAIKDHGLRCDRYFMLDAAAAMEAYDDMAREALMVDGAWTIVPTRYWASEWHSLFSGDAYTNDVRRILDWRGRFSGMTNAVNFYSTTEDVVGNINTNDHFQTVWVEQERRKGTMAWHVLNSIPIISSSAEIEGGWGINTYYAADPRWYIPIYGFASNKVNSLTREQAITHPLFTPFGIHDEEMHSLDPYDGSDENGLHDGWEPAHGFDPTTHNFRTSRTDDDPQGLFGEHGDDNGAFTGAGKTAWLRIPDEDGDVPEYGEDEDPPYRPNQRAWTVPEEAVFNAEPQSRGGRKGAREETHGDSA